MQDSIAFNRFNKIVTIIYVAGIQYFVRMKMCFLSFDSLSEGSKDLEVKKKVVPLHSHLKNGWLMRLNEFL